MAAYRVPEFTLEQRVDVALHMLNPDREWGLVSKLAGLPGVGRALTSPRADFPAHGLRLMLFHVGA